MSLYVKALDNDPNYQAAVAADQEELEARPQALAKLLPHLYAGAHVAEAHQSVSGQFFVDTIGNSAGFNVNHSDQFFQAGYSVLLTQALFHRDLFLNLDQADLKVAQAALQLDEAQDALRLQVAKAYFSVLSARDQLRFAKAERDALKQLNEQSKDRHDAGLISDADYKQAQAAYDQSQAALIVARNQLQVARTQLQLLTGSSPTQLKDLPAELHLPPPDPDSAETWITRANTQNLSVQIHRLSTRIAELGLQSAKAKRWPTLDADAYRNYDEADGGISSGIGAGSNHGVDERVMLQLKIPLYVGGAISSGIRAARAGLARAQAQEAASRAKAQQNAQVAFLNAEAGQARIKALKLSMDSAAAAEDAARTGYNVGTRTYADLLSSIQSHYQAEGQYSQSRYDYVENLLALKQAAGSLSADDLQQINGWLQ